jgi:hypothetical protein
MDEILNKYLKDWKINLIFFVDFSFQRISFAMYA